MELKIRNNTCTLTCRVITINIRSYKRYSIEYFWLDWQVNISKALISFFFVHCCTCGPNFRQILIQFDFSNWLDYASWLFLWDAPVSGFAPVHTLLWCSLAAILLIQLYLSVGVWWKTVRGYCKHQHLYLRLFSLSLRKVPDRKHRSSGYIIPSAF